MTSDSAAENAQPSDFGARLKHCRKLAGLSQTHLAAELGYHNSVISRWENGTRQPPLKLIRRLDTILDTGGQLTQLIADQTSRDGRQGDLLGFGPDTPLPGGPARAYPPMAWDPGRWPSRLPHYGMSCPQHGPHGCVVPSTEDATALHQAFTADPARHTDADIVHVLAARLAVYTRLTEEHGTTGIDTAIENELHLIGMSLNSPAGPSRQALLHLAATYAAFAGQLRTLRGQHGAAMALYGKGLHWALLCGDVSLRAALMCDMSTLARLENDSRSALSYAEALPSIGPNRTWTRTLAHLYSARAHGLVGDLQETSRAVTAARDHLDRHTTDDEQEARWISGIHGQVLIESGIAAALRDVAAATADHRLAHAAIAATEHSLAFVPVHVRPATVLLALRLADSYACAGQPDAAAAIATPILAEAKTMPMATVSHELRGLRTRLAARWPNTTPVKEFLDHCHH
ncbi:putative DNA-binding protein [Alloactinosynnema sp. L-07]|uniref:helix-turn-helix domain-containing protein n=1 Tax=Alloactinosynnema sp. L-07 TaxID=1653480 RepID=UPI00065F0A37|nr:helix-turn-helix transcriptional regulator [Alloactinosynnema sp. L-07]CRK57754.1 putative DNA-binding protein [Alloactinosynnema sp. L-07]